MSHIHATHPVHPVCIISRKLQIANCINTLTYLIIPLRESTFMIYFVLCRYNQICKVQSRCTLYVRDVLSEVTSRQFGCF